MTTIYSLSGPGTLSEAEKLQEFADQPAPIKKGKGLVALFVLGLLLAATGNAVSSTKKKKK